MNIATKFLCVLMAVSCMLSVMAQKVPTPPPTPDIKKGKLDRQSFPKGHRAPSSVFLEYEYMGEGIYVYPAESYFEYEVTVSGLYDGFECSASMSPDEGYYIETGALQGEYSISAVTPDGVVFSGTLSVE